MQKLETLAWQFRIQGWNVALGASGTIKAAQEVLVAMGEKDGFITPERLEMLVDEVLKYKNFDALSLPGLSEERKAVFAPGLAILCGVSMRWRSKSCACLMARCVKACCMRWRTFSPSGYPHRTAQSLANQYNIDREQARRVLETTTHIFEQWQEQNPKLDNPNLSALLKWAVMLHEVGLNINHSGMHRHSAYILQNSDLPGFNQGSKC